MEIVGTGFIARNLRPVADQFPGATVLAAGVSRTRAVPEAEYAREKELVLQVAGRCRARGRLLVLLSTATYAMYGATSEPVAEDAPVAPETAYGRHKRDLELTVADAVPDWLVLRLSHVAGAGQPPWHLLPNLVEQLAGGEVVLHAGAERDLVDVADVRATLAGLLAAGVTREIVNVACGTPFPIESIVDAIERRLGTSAARRVVPGPSGRTLVSIAKLRRLVPGPAAGLGGERYLHRIVGRYAPRYAAANAQ